MRPSLTEEVGHDAVDPDLPVVGRMSPFHRFMEPDQVIAVHRGVRLQHESGRLVLVHLRGGFCEGATGVGRERKQVNDAEHRVAGPLVFGIVVCQMGSFWVGLGTVPAGRPGQSCRFG